MGVPAIDAVLDTAAGDAFAAGFLVAWTAGADLEAAVVAGHASARDAILARIVVNVTATGTAGLAIVGSGRAGGIVLPALRLSRDDKATWPSGSGKGLQSPVHGFDSHRRLRFFRAVGSSAHSGAVAAITVEGTADAVLARWDDANHRA